MSREWLNIIESTEHSVLLVRVTGYKHVRLGVDFTKRLEFASSQTEIKMFLYISLQKCLNKPWALLTRRRRFWVSCPYVTTSALRKWLWTDIVSTPSAAVYFDVLCELMCGNLCRTFQYPLELKNLNLTLLPESASELYRPSDHLLSAKKILRIEGATCSAWRIPTAVFSVF
jgi:hypothetical protein